MIRLRHLLALLFVLVASPFAAAQTRPNVVYIMADDLGYGDLGCYGCEDIRTPAIDRLAAQGVRLTSFYANGPECSPTRAAFLTGRYQHRVGGLECAIGLGGVGRYDDAIALAERGELGLPPSETSIARLLQNAGYATALVGKWHLGYGDKFAPARHGFDFFFGPLGGAVDYFHHGEPGGEHMLYQNGKEVRREGYLTDLITDAASDYIRAQKPGRPFFLYVAYTAPHSPYQRPGRKNAEPTSLEDFNKGTRGDYKAMVEALDAGVGRILQSLADAGLADDTLVVFCSDNGGVTRIARNAPYSGGKGGLFEGGVRVPCVVRWPGELPAGGTSDQPAITMDLSKSIVRVAGAKEPEGRPFDGIDVIDRLQKNQPPADRTLFWRARRGDQTWRAVRDGALKYITRQDGGKRQEYLFDLARDPQEKMNLAADRPAEVRRLELLLTRWEEEVRAAR